MFPKQTAYILISVIALFIVLFGYSIYSNYTNKLETDKKISTVISKFEEKFKKDSIYLANTNKLLIDKISQHLIDSISNVYEQKLELAIQQSKKYKDILIANNIDFNIPNHPTKTDDKIINSNLDIKVINSNSKKKQKNKLHVTTVSSVKKQKKVSNFNITTYSKLPTNKNTTIKKPSTDNSNSQHLISQKKSVPNIITTPKKQNTTHNNKQNITHNNFDLDHAKNINELSEIPLFKECKKLTTKAEKSNCFAVKISHHIINKFNSLNNQTPKLKRGLHKVRVLFIITKKGNAKFIKIVGKWPNIIYENVRKSVESTPIMTPGKYNNKSVPVKYSLLIPFVIK